MNGTWEYHCIHDDKLVKHHGLRKEVKGWPPCAAPVVMMLLEFMANLLTISESLFFMCGGVSVVHPPLSLAADTAASGGGCSSSGVGAASSFSAGG